MSHQRAVTQVETGKPSVELHSLAGECWPVRSGILILLKDKDGSKDHLNN